MKFLDRGAIRKAVTDAVSGFLRAPATLTRTGVFQYVIDSQGEFVFGAAIGTPGTRTIGVLRSPDEVFSDASMASFELVPVVDDHPYTEPDSAVTTTNAKRLQVGSVGAPFRNGDLLEATVCITDAEMIEKIRSGKVSLSCGYFADTIDAPEGATFEGIPYHKIQKNIRGNHLAVCDAGRAGVSRLHLDSVVEVEETSSQVKPTLSNPGAAAPNTEKRTMIKITLDGLPFEVSEVVAAAIEKHNKATGEVLAANATEIAALKGNATKLQAVCDSSAAEIVNLKAKVTEISAPAFIASKIAERVEVEKLATKHGLTADGKDLTAVKREVITKLNPSIDAKKLESAVYVDAYFDSMTVTPAGNAVTDAAAALLKGANVPAVAITLDEETKRKNFNAAIYGADASKAQA